MMASSKRTVLPLPLGAPGRRGETQLCERNIEGEADTTPGATRGGG